MLRFEPKYKNVTWGGRRLQEEFGRVLPEGLVGESWELVSMDGTESVVAQGPHQGRALGELWREGVLGGSAQGCFPFLLKWLDASAKLSVQVHPDADACAALGKGKPKTEAWYVAYADPKAVLHAGHYPGLDALSLKQAAQSGTLHKWLYETYPRRGDFYTLKAGTLHAVGAGVLLLEVQEPSDTTYRLYDWGRVGPDGVGRPLHLEEAAASVRYERHGGLQASRQGALGPRFMMRVLGHGAEIPAQYLRVFVAGMGPASLACDAGVVDLQPGDVVVAEREDSLVKVVHGQVVFVTEWIAAS
jgi:mannose-6-phosphate isomerase